MEERILETLSLLDERQKRLYLAIVAKAYGRGGISKMNRISGVSRNTIRRGIKECESGEVYDGTVRKSYASDFLYNRKSRKISEKLAKNGVTVHYTTVGKIIESMGNSKQQNQKMLQVGIANPNRNEQFEYINQTAAGYISAGIPVISVDAKKRISVILRTMGGNIAKKVVHAKCLTTIFLSKSWGKLLHMAFITSIKTLDLSMSGQVMQR